MNAVSIYPSIVVRIVLFTVLGFILGRADFKNMEKSAEATVITYPVCSEENILGQLLGAKVQVTMVNNTSHEGFIYSADPITGSLFLISHGQEKGSVKLLIGGSIRSLLLIKQTNSKILQKALENEEAECPLRDDKLQDSLFNWFTERRVPVSRIEGNLLVLDEVIVTPPFRQDDCLCTNEIVLLRVQKLLALYTDNQPASPTS